jgi:hypothetical protein
MTEPSEEAPFVTMRLVQDSAGTEIPDRARTNAPTINDALFIMLSFGWGASGGQARRTRLKQRRGVVTPLPGVYRRGSIVSNARGDRPGCRYLRSTIFFVSDTLPVFSVQK